MKKVIWLDVDGVLLDYTRPFLEFAQVPYTYETLLDYDLRKLFASEQECLDCMLAFAMSDTFHELPASANPEYLRALKNVGYDIRIITKLPAPSAARTARVMNLTRIFGDMFSDIVFTSHECKLDLLKRKQSIADNMAPYTLFEDNPSLLAKYDAKFRYYNHSNNFRVIAVRHPYNELVTSKLINTEVVDSFDVAAKSLIQREVGNG